MSAMQRAMMPGRWTFEYSIVPHAGGWHTAFQEAHAFNRPLRAIRTSRGKARLPQSASLLTTTSPDFVVSTIKLAEDDDSVIVRAYNISNGPIDAGVSVNGVSATAVDLNEENASAVDATRMALAPNQIIPLKFG